MKIAYRASQFLNALFARLTPEDHLLIEKTLPPSLLEVFRRMGRSDQLHGVRVLRSVRAGGTDHPTLCAAALLHDVGKSRHHPRLWDRILVVLATALFPEAVERWGNAGEPRGLRRPFIIGRAGRSGPPPSRNPSAAAADADRSFTPPPAAGRR